MAITNPHYLLQRAAEAYQQMENPQVQNPDYWKGVFDTYQYLWQNSFDATEKGSLSIRMANLIFTRGFSYDAASLEVYGYN